MSYPHHGWYAAALSISSIILGTYLVYYPVIPFADIAAGIIYVGGNAVAAWLWFTEWHEHAYHKEEEHHTEDLTKLDNWLRRLFRK